MNEGLLRAIPKDEQSEQRWGLLFALLVHALLLLGIWLMTFLLCPLATQAFQWCGSPSRIDSMVSPIVHWFHCETYHLIPLGFVALFVDGGFYRRIRRKGGEKAATIYAMVTTAVLWVISTIYTLALLHALVLRQYGSFREIVDGFHF